jgi:hypothetical protein
LSGLIVDMIRAFSPGRLATIRAVHISAVHQTATPC